jgi:hypothetical protein
MVAYSYRVRQLRIAPLVRGKWHIICCACSHLHEFGRRIGHHGVGISAQAGEDGRRVRSRQICVALRAGGSVLAPLPAAIIMISISTFVLAAVGRDWLVARRIHRLTWGLAGLRMISGFLEAMIGHHRAALHQLVGWLAR